MLNKLNTRYILRLIFIAFLLLVMLLTVGKFSTFKTADLLLERQTTKYLQKEYTNENIKFIYLTDEDYKLMHDDPVEFNKGVSALLDNHLNDSSSVVFDFILTESGDINTDIALANSLNNVPSSVISYEEDDFSKERYPSQMFITNAAYCGYRNFNYDAAGYADYYYPLIESDLNTLSLTTAVLESNNAKVSVDKKNKLVSITSKYFNPIVQLNDDYSFKRIPITFLDKSKYNARDIISGNYEPYDFKDRVVFIGFEDDTVQTHYGTVTHTEFTANGVVSLITNYTYTYASVVQVFIVGLILLLVLFFAEKSSKWWLRFSVVVFMIVFTFLLNFLSAKYLHIYFNLSSTITYVVIVFLISTFSSYFIVREELVRDGSIVQEILVLNNIKISESTFNNYLISIAPSILQKSGVEIVRPELFEDAPILEKLFSKADLNGQDVVFKRNYILIPLQKYRNDSPNRYCLLKSKLLVSDASVKNIIAFILSIDFHFKHIIETKRENKLLYSVIEGIILSLNARDAITGEHSRRVAEFSVQIGGWLGFTDEELEKLHFASLIHDIGKIGISDAILAKPSFFSDKDFDTMKKHPELGIEIMGQFLEDEDIKSAILQHHERPDGRGYPYGITADEIRPIARIIKIADVYDALTSARHYKDAWPIEKVCDVLYQGSGAEFDEDLIDIVLEHIKPDSWVPPKASQGQTPHYFSDDLKAISVDIYKNAMYSTRGLKTTEPTSDIIDFARFKEVLGLSLGDIVTSPNFLYLSPSIVYTNEDKETTYYAKPNIGNYAKVVLLFLRNYHTGGCFISGLGDSKVEFADEIKKSFGAPLFRDKSLTAWCSPNGQMYYVLFESQSPELENAFVYFNRYLQFAD